LLLGNGPRTQRCKAIGIEKEEEEEANKMLFSENDGKSKRKENRNMKVMKIDG
jgi:hypothetical protein